MASKIKTPKQAINPAFLRQKPTRPEIELFKKEFIALLDRINVKESEEFHKNLIKDFLNSVYYKDKHYINTRGKNDLVIHNGNNTLSPVGVLIETKSPANKAEMVSHDNLNVKSFQELILYYLRERKTEKNIELRHLIITNIYEWFVFDARDFEKLFYQNKALLDHFEQFQAGKLSGASTDFFYREIASPEIQKLRNEISYTYLDIRDYDRIIHDTDKEDDRRLIALYKFLSPVHLLKHPFANDTNQLNRGFYDELLHIIGLEEIVRDNKKLIVRKNEKDRDGGSIIENTIERINAKSKLNNQTAEQYGKTKEEQLFGVALNLAITWINRILFLKLLESQILKYHKGNKDYAFLSTDKLQDYNDLDMLFFSVLALRKDERNENVKVRFEHVPYLNSSLFEITEIEDKTICIDSLQNNISLALYSGSVLRVGTGGRGNDRNDQPKMKPLEYLLRFLDAYDFSSEGSEDIQEENKPLISASVLGLIFEKINGYRDGSFFTPSFITMYMCRETITRAVIQKFNDEKGWSCSNITELYNKIENIDEANSILNSLCICDPAVGSGHFLVSALNEMIRLKSELGILTDKSGRRLKDYRVTVENDELIVTDNEGNHFTYNPENTESRRVQEAFFNEKQTIIENCLFGVDINPNSVKICQLRLWIELLKHTYYHSETGELETLPNIDINIKCGNSLINRFDLHGNYATLPFSTQQTLRIATQQYKQQVILYKSTNDKTDKKHIRENIARIKETFSQVRNPDDVDYRKWKDAEAKSAHHFASMSFNDRDEWNKKLAQLRVDEDVLGEKYEQKLKTLYSNSFEWSFEFPEVLDDYGNFIGFDVIIGNPPYGVKFEKYAEEYFLKNYRHQDYQFDSYTLFIERAVKLLNNGSHLGFIIPNTWLLNLKTPKIRRYIFSNTQIINIAHYQNAVFTAATVDTEIVIFKNKKAEITNKVIIDIYDRKNTKTEQEIEQQNWIKADGAPINIFDNGRNDSIKLKVRSLPILDMICKITQGTKPFQVGKGKPPQTRETVNTKPYVSNIKIDEQFVPLLRGSLMNRYQILWNNNYFIKFGNWLAEPRYSADYEAPEKIIIRQTGDHLNATLDSNQFIVRDNLYTIIPKNANMNLCFILGLLNSRFLNWYYQNVLNYEKGEALAQVKRGHIAQLPIPDVEKPRQEPLISLVKEILQQKKEKPTADTSALETEIDKLVYKLYGLTDEEISIIEE